jgi:hypothetical protein
LKGERKKQNTHPVSWVRGLGEAEMLKRALLVWAFHRDHHQMALLAQNDRVLPERGEGAVCLPAVRVAERGVSLPSFPFCSGAFVNGCL